MKEWNLKNDNLPTLTFPLFISTYSTKMPLVEKRFLRVISEIENWANYETTARPRNISKLIGIRTLLKDLGNPENTFKNIHIAGTNGKGQTATIINQL